MNNFRTILLLIFVVTLKVSAQKTLKVFAQHFGKTKQYVFYNNEVLQYKLKGDWHYKRDKIVNMQDSSIVFANDSVVRLNDIKAIRFHRGGHLAKTFQEAFLIGGIGFFGLNTLNNGIMSREPLVDSKAVYIGGALVATSFVIKMICTKHLRIRKNTVMKINAVKYEELNRKD